VGATPGVAKYNTMNSVTTLTLDEATLARCQGGFLPALPTILPFRLDDIPGLCEPLRELMRPQTLADFLRQFGLSVDS
jgi:hypothetical protein